jgi:tetratricopeptide (TPR) repeat protein
MTASDYNLGRIAFETGRYEAAAVHFERVLNRDEFNVMALKAAAYSRIKNGDLKKAEALYDRVLALVPENADDGYNYALVLYAMEKYENCEEVLNRYPYTLEENSASLLLLARAQKAQKKVEAADTYAKWRTVHTGAANPRGLYEYAQVLEDAGLYARALEQYEETIKALTADTEELKKSTLRFEKARLLLTVDPENNEGITELSSAVNDGFSDTEAIEALLRDDRITQANKDEIRKVIDGILSKQQGETGSDDAQESEDAGIEIF